MCYIAGLVMTKIGSALVILVAMLGGARKVWAVAMNRLGILTFVLFLISAVPANAGPFEDGLAAYDRGNYATALEIWIPLAGQGDAKAQYYLGTAYAEGRGVPQDDVDAAWWWRMAAEQGLARAQNSLGFVYANGRGVPRDDGEAAKWYRLANAQESTVTETEETIAEDTSTPAAVPKVDPIGPRKVRKIPVRRESAIVAESANAKIDRFPDDAFIRLKENARWIQIWLAELGYDPGPVDGLIGPRTNSAISRFKADIGLDNKVQSGVDLFRELTKALASTKTQKEIAPDPIFDAIRSRNANIVASILRSDPSAVDARTIFGGTPLILASSVGDIHVVRQLLDAGSDINAINALGATALFSTIDPEFFEVADLLLSQGADVTLRLVNGYSILHRIPENSAALVERFVQAGADANARTTNGQVPLHLAAREGRLMVVEALLANGADPTAKDSSGQTPLHSAGEPVGADVASATRRLREAGFSRDVQEEILSSRDLSELQENLGKATVKLDELFDIFPRTRLSPEIERRKVAIAKALLEAGADVNAATNNLYSTPLHAATTRSSGKIAELLISAGAKINTKNSLGQTPLFQSVVQGAEQVARLLIKNGADVGAKDNFGGSALRVAVKVENISLMQLLLERGADVDEKDENGWTPLARVIAKGRTEAVEILLAHGADVHARDNAGFTPLNTAAEKGELESAKLLLDHGADPHTQENKGYTPVISAAAFGHADVIDLLLENGADLNIANQNGQTALHVAAFESYISAVNLLLERGAQIDARDVKGQTPLYYWALGEWADGQTAAPGDYVHRATNEDFLATGQSLIDAEADIQAADEKGETPLHLASSYGDVRAIRFLLSNGANVNIMNKFGNTPLHSVAYKSGDVASARLLIVNGADIEARNNPEFLTQQSTPLLAAAVAGHAKLVELLIDLGANPRATSMKGGTALHFAAWKGHMEVAKILLSNGVDVNARDHNGITPIRLAEHYGHSELVQFLRARGATN